MARNDFEREGAPVQPALSELRSVMTDLALLRSKRVSVIVGKDIVPLLPGKPVLDSTKSPWNGLYLEMHNLDAVPIPKHEHGTFVLHLQMNERVEMDWHTSGRYGHQVTGAGNLILLPPGTRDKLLFYGPSRRIVVSIDPLLIKEAADHMELAGMPDFEIDWLFKDEQLRLLITEMEREMSTGWALGSLYGESLSSALVISLIKKYAKTFLPRCESKGGLSRPRLRLVLSYIEEHMDHDIRLRDLANIAGLSEYHFARSFRQTTGSTPHQHLTSIRISRAKSLLLRPHWTVFQVAEAVGFSDPGRFTKVFRTNTGLSPAKWRRDV